MNKANFSRKTLFQIPQDLGINSTYALTLFTFYQLRTTPN